VSSRIADIAPKLQKLVLLLSSDQPGEVAAAAKAIERALQGIGADWHDLARELAKPAPAAPQPNTSKNNGYSHRWDDDDDDDDWRELRDFCQRHENWLHGREQDFIETLEHWRGRPTEKQMNWLRSIYARLRRAGL
jgi:hypothetical protein